MVPVAVLAVAGCGKKEEAKNGSPTGGLAEEVVEAVKEAVTPGLSPEERAEIVGIAGLVAPDADGVLALIDGKGAVDGLRGMKWWQTVREVAKEEEGVDPEEEISSELAQVAPFLSEEIALVYGDGTAEFLGLYADFARRMNYYQFRMFGRALAEGVVSGDVEGSFESMDNNAYMMEMTGEVARFLPRLEGMDIPGMLMGVKVSDAGIRDQAGQQLLGLMAMAGEAGEPVEFTKAGATFTGYRFKGELLAAQMEADRGDMDETLGREETDKLISIVKEKALVVATGTVGPRVLLFVGGSVDACPLVDEVGDSLAASDEVSFIDGFRSTPVHAFSFGAKAVLEELTGANGLKEMAEGLRDGLKSVDGFGDPRELVALLDLVGEQEERLLELSTCSTMGGVVSVDGGVKFETFGGLDNGASDLTNEHRLSGLGEAENVLLFADGLANPEYKKRSGELVDLGVNIAYALAGHVATLEPKGELAQFQQMFGMFDGMFREDVVKLWDGICLAGEGLGDEGALVVDLAASVPPLPGVPAAIVEGGRFPRISYVAPVTDRAKLGESWKAVDGSTRELLAKVREMGVEGVNMLVPTSAEKNDMVTWYFDALAFSDDLKPSVTVTDSWFAASTSKTQAQELIARAEEKSGEPKRGVWVELNVDVLRQYIEDSVKLVDERGDEIIPSESDLADFREALPMIRRGIDALSDVKKVTLHERLDNGSLRTTLHFHAR